MRQMQLATKSATTARLSTRCTRPIVRALVPLGIASRSSNPNTAATSAPAMPMPISQYAPSTSGGDPPLFAWLAMSNTRLAIHAPIGRVTRIGWNGWPYGPAITVTGSLARSTLLATSGSGRSPALMAMGDLPVRDVTAPLPGSAERQTGSDDLRGHPEPVLVRLHQRAVLGQVEAGVLPAVVVGRAAAGVALGHVRVEPRPDVVGPRQLPLLVQPRHAPDRVGHEIRVEHVGDAPAREVAGVALRGDAVHLQLEAHRQELDERGVVHLVRVHPAQRRHHVGERA